MELALTPAELTDKVELLGQELAQLKHKLTLHVENTAALQSSTQVTISLLNEEMDLSIKAGNMILELIGMIKELYPRIEALENV